MTTMPPHAIFPVCPGCGCKVEHCEKWLVDRDSPPIYSSFCCNCYRAELIPAPGNLQVLPHPWELYDTGVDHPGPCCGRGFFLPPGSGWKRFIFPELERRGLGRVITTEIREYAAPPTTDPPHIDSR